MRATRSAHSLTPVVWVGFIALLIGGVGPAIGRATHIDNFGTSVDGFRTAVFSALGVTDPKAAERPAEIDRVDGSFGAKPRTTLLHVLGGAFFFLFLPLQFSRRLRANHPAVHRWSGRVLLLIGVSAALSGLYFGVLRPYAGPAEAIVVALFGMFFLVAATRAWLAIRSGDSRTHREWMLRAVAVALGIATVRYIALPLDLALTLMGIGPRTGFVIAISFGWTLTLATTEWWIRATRRSPREIPA